VERVFIFVKRRILSSFVHHKFATITNVSYPQDKHGNTPLHCASYRGHKDVVVRLLQHGADASIPNNGGRTPLDVAMNDVMRTLLDCMHRIDRLGQPSIRGRFSQLVVALISAKATVHAWGKSPRLDGHDATHRLPISDACARHTMI
jgi:hypothetical protein